MSITSQSVHVVNAVRTSRLTRRLAGSALTAAALAAPLTAGPACGAAAGPSVYVFESDANGFNTRTVFVDSGAAVAAFDAQFTPQLADAAIAFLRAKTKSPLRYLIVTHPNPDKFNGLASFKAAGATVVASEATAAAMPDVQRYKKAFFVETAKMFTDASYPALGTIDRTFRGKLDLDLGRGTRIALAELAQPGVSSTQTVAYVPQAKALIVGDLVHHKAHAWLEGGLVGGRPTPTVAGWIKDLRELEARYGKDAPTVYGGRGEAAPLGVAIPAQIAYLEKADAIVSAYVAKLGAARSELATAKAGAHFAALQKELEAAFPDYALGYMIQYGVYGLALSK
jgi:glyoxylase-like metal-dependent hydrolase (beta-lactamase superfamily II)